jgi:glucokinase
MLDNRFVLGIDLGGTKIAAGVLDFDHRLIGEIFTLPTDAHRPAEVTLGNISRAAVQALQFAGLEFSRPEAVGIGSTGPVEAATGRILDATSLPNLNFFDLADWVRQQFDAPLFIENDANCFALGEALQGAGAGRRTVVAVTLGTGFGCGIVIDGAMYSGTTGNSGEVANCPVADDTFDNMLSGAGVRRFYERALGSSSPLSAREIGDLAERGEATALRAWQDYGDAVGSALGTIAAVIDPAVCVIGGSVSARLPLFEAPLRARLQSILAPAAAASLQIARAQLGPAAGVIGAAEYAFQRLKTSLPQRHKDTKKNIEEIAKSVVDAAFHVHSTLGPGLLESVYELCLTHELVKHGLKVERQVALPVSYDSMRLDAALRLDLVVEGSLLVELKAVETLLPVHKAQVLTYLKLSGHRLGLLINFNVPLIKDGIKRLIL